MPKETHREFLSRMVATYPKIFRRDNSVLFCIMCECNVNANKIFQVKQHLSGGKHIAAERRQVKDPGPSQSLITGFAQNELTLNEFCMDLTKMLIQSNIPLNCVAKKPFIDFMEKYTKKGIPNCTTLRKKYISKLYESQLETIRMKAAGKRIWVSIDESTDCEQRMVVNVVFGILCEENEIGKTYFLNAELADKVNASTIAAIFNNSLALLWPTGEFGTLCVDEV
jgi:hypothetical protein